MDLHKNFRYIYIYRRKKIQNWKWGQENINSTPEVERMEVTLD